MEKEIFDELKKIIENSKSKYYNYPVAAILKSKDGKLYYGVNIETSSPQAGICAERCALFAALTDGLSADDFETIYILNKTNNLITPCFICRQALNDYCNSDLKIITFNNLGNSKTYILKDLCVASFGKESLQ